jgi:xylulokinase
MMNLHHVVPGWITFGIVDCGGGALRWFKDALCHEEVRRGQETGRSPYELLDEYASAVEPGSEGLLFFPYLFGERTLGSPHARGVFFGLVPQHGKGAMARAIMEGVTLELRRTLEIVETSGNLVEEVRTTGGGARSPLWSQIKADIYQKPVVTFEAFEGSILGVAILAGIGAGVYPDAQTGAERLIRLGRIFDPNPATRNRYDFLFARYKELHEAMQGPFDRYREVA